MMLSLSVGTVGRTTVGAVRMEIDWGRRTWSVGARQPGWTQSRLPERGPLEVRPTGALWLLEPIARALMITIDNGPTGPLDSAHRTGNGTLCDVTNPQWPVTKLSWSREEASTSGPAASASAPIRTQAVAVCTRNLPASGVQEPANCVESTPGKKKGADGATGCGGFPGWMIKELGAEKFSKQTITVKWTAPDGAQKQATIGVTSPTIGWEQLALGIEKARGSPPGTLWKLYTPGGPRPLPGDIYTLKKPSGAFRHVGVIIDPTGSAWKTADGGQGLGFAVGFRARTFDPSTGKLEGEDKQPAFLKGWVDLEALLEKT
ncbi:hypothetical protein [Reyranella sp. CPCC 100927]|uniref:hypothetical protein n=1 Tax=Reyranella sp. CPCC 100927 TaxID=2599616 RepID=UPI0011B464CE|nr:hypothetical protein [Reyranella sp. CPCC 100927]TWT01681.1 hypothetical protein FQU96_31850 [Reyranella sp. CPCC 100927]